MTKSVQPGNYISTASWKAARSASAIGMRAVFLPEYLVIPGPQSSLSHAHDIQDLGEKAARVTVDLFVHVLVFRRPPLAEPGGEHGVRAGLQRRS